MFSRIILLVNSYLCYKKKTPLSSVACFILILFYFSFCIVVLQCFGHVFKLDCEQLKLVCQSMETWPQTTLLSYTVSEVGAMYEQGDEKCWHGR